MTVTATDPDGLSISTDFVWSVDNVAPVSMSLPPVNVFDGEAISIPTASGFDDPDGDDLIYTVANLPLGLSIDPLTGVISGTLDNSASQGGPYVITVTATDAQGESVDVTFELVVENPAPVVRAIPLPSSIGGEYIEINVGEMADDPDGDGNLTYKSDDLPLGLTIDPQTGIISGNPAPSNEPITFTVSVDDGEGGVTFVTLSLNVSDEAFTLDPRNLDARIVDNDGLVNGNSDYDARDSADTSVERIDMERWFSERRDDSMTTSPYGRGDASFLGGVVKIAATEYGDNAGIMVEAVASRHTLTLQLMETISENSDVSVKSWDVSPARGGSFPEWVDYTRGQDLLTVNRSAEQVTMQIRVRALLDNGRSISTLVDVDLKGGIVERAGPASTADQTFDQQLQVAVSVEVAEDDALIKALAG